MADVKSVYERPKNVEMLGTRRSLLRLNSKSSCLQHSIGEYHCVLLHYKAFIYYVLILSQPRPVAGFRGTVRYASINAHKNKVSMDQTHIFCSNVLRP